MFRYGRMCADSRQSCFRSERTGLARLLEEQPRSRTEMLPRVIAVVRLRMTLLSYLHTVPAALGLSPRAPFLDIELALRMLTLPSEQRLERRWEHEFFAAHEVDLEAAEPPRDHRNVLNARPCDGGRSSRSTSACCARSCGRTTSAGSTATSDLSGCRTSSSLGSAWEPGFRRAVKAGRRLGSPTAGGGLRGVPHARPLQALLRRRDAPPAGRRMSAATPRVTFGVIVLNGMPFLPYNLRALYPFAHQIIVVEGRLRARAATPLPDGHSRDGTLAELARFAREEDPDGKLTIVTAEDEGRPDGFWPGEKDEQSRAYASRATGDYLWQADIDEFYRPQDMGRILGRAGGRPDVDGRHVPDTSRSGARPTASPTGGSCARRRRLPSPVPVGTGYTYAAHRPPTVLDRGGRDTRAARLAGRRRDGRSASPCYHYSLLFPFQAVEKVEYYSNWGSSMRLVPRGRAHALAGGLVSEPAASLPGAQRVALSRAGWERYDAAAIRPRRSGCSPTSPPAASPSRGGGWTTPSACWRPRRYALGRRLLKAARTIGATAAPAALDRRPRRPPAGEPAGEEERDTCAYSGSQSGSHRLCGATSAFPQSRVPQAWVDSLADEAERTPGRRADDRDAERRCVRAVRGGRRPLHGPAEARPDVRGPAGSRRAGGTACCPRRR